MPQTKYLTTTALLAVLILISGFFKLPSPFPGGEFQLSAPLAVLICAHFGFRQYFLAGAIASTLSLLLGFANPYGVLVALVFRLVAGLVLVCGKARPPVLAVAGPLGTFAARLVLSMLTGISWQILALAALPGMIFTAATSVLLFKPCQKLLQRIASRRS